MVEKLLHKLERLFLMDEVLVDSDGNEAAAFFEGLASIRAKNEEEIENIFNELVGKEFEGCFKISTNYAILLGIPERADAYAIGKGTEFFSRHNLYPVAYCRILWEY